MARRAYYRCNGGDYFRGTDNCPVDGSHAPGALLLAAAEQRLIEGDRELSIELLRQIGLSDAVLARTIVIEFADDESMFEAMAPESYIIHGELRLRFDWPSGLT